MRPIAPIVVKLGGALLNDLHNLAPMWRVLQRVHQHAPLVLVHGGGAQATALANRLGHSPRIVQGRRVTTDLDLNLVQWTMRGELNVQLVAEAAKHGLAAVGLSGADGNILLVTKRSPWQIAGETVDFGWVGDVKGVNTTLLDTLLSNRFLPIVAPLGIDGVGQIYNVNADTVAQALAVALGASCLYLVAESGGVYRDLDDPASLLRTCDLTTFQKGINEGWIHGGMRVKLTVAFEALSAGIPKVCICAPSDLLSQKNATLVAQQEAVMCVR